MLLPLMLLAQAADPFGDQAWGRFSRAPALTYSRETVDIAFDDFVRGATERGSRYKLRLTRVPFHGPSQVLWASSDTCAAVKPLLESVASLPAPRIRSPEVPGEEVAIILDGTNYVLRVPAAWGGSGGTVEMSSNVDTPLATWVVGAFARLAPCWSAVEPPRATDFP